MKALATTVLRGCGEIFFLQARWYGAALLAITLLAPPLALAGLLALAAAYGFSCLIGNRRQFLDGGPLIYNSFWWCSAADIIPPHARHTAVDDPGRRAGRGGDDVAGQASAAGPRLPLLSLPFALVATLVSLAALRWTNIPAAVPFAQSFLADDLGLPRGWPAC